MTLSKESTEFLDNLRVYLFASGKNEQEVDSIVSELEDHLREAESKGKNIQHIIGSSPKEYMEQLAKELDFDYVAAMKYVPMTIIGFLAFVILGDALRFEIDYSWFELVGYPVVALLLIGVTMGTFKFLAGRQWKRGKQMALLTGLGIFNIGAFLLLIFLSDKFGTPVFVLNQTGQWIVIAISAILLIGIAILIKMWLPIILPMALYGPEVILKWSFLQEWLKWDDVMITFVGSLIGYAILFVYFIVQIRLLNKKEERSS